MRTQAILALTVLIGTILAGCASGSGDTSIEGLDQCPDGDCGEGAAITGRVLDDQSLPIAGATVGLTETGNTTRTGEGGGFAFTGLEPGTYTLNAVALGYESAAQRVTLEADQKQEVSLTLAPLPVSEPYTDVIGPEAGHFLCSVYVPAWGIENCNIQGAMGEDKQTVTFQLSSPELWQTIVGEMRWTQGTAATSNRLANYISYEGREATHWWCEADGESPIVFQYEREEDSICTSQGDTDPEPHDEEVETLFIAADSGFGGLSTENPPWRLAYDQRYELMVSIFYVDAAPTGYSALPDQ